MGISERFGGDWCVYYRQKKWLRYFRPSRQNNEKGLRKIMFEGGWRRTIVHKSRFRKLTEILDYFWQIQPFIHILGSPPAQISAHFSPKWNSNHINFSNYSINRAKRNAIGKRPFSASYVPAERCMVQPRPELDYFIQQSR